MSNRKRFQPLAQTLGSVLVGELCRCHETGKVFVAKQEGMTFNYAKDAQGWIYSDEGVDIRERRQFFEHWHAGKPVYCYLFQGDAMYVTGWKGNVLGNVVRRSYARGFHNSMQVCVSVKDTHGNYWHGRGAGPGMSITLRPSKRAPR